MKTFIVLSLIALFAAAPSALAGGEGKSCKHSPFAKQGRTEEAVKVYFKKVSDKKAILGS